MSLKRLLVRIGFVIGALALVGNWWVAVAAFDQGRLFVRANYWNAPIGTWTLLIVLAALTPAWFWAVWHYWNWQGYGSSGD